MTGTPDAHHGEILEDVGIEFSDNPSAPSSPGEFRYHSGEFWVYDSVGLFSLRSGGGGITEAQHRVLRQLIHFIEDGPAEGFASGAYRETLPAPSPFPTSIIWWESGAKLKKIVERLVTWTGANPTTDQWKIYDTDGTTVLWIVTDTISYTGAFETSRTRAIAAGP